MTALGFWHLLQYCISPKLSYMPRWKSYLKRLAEMDLTPNMSCEGPKIHLGFCSNLCCSKSLLLHFLFVPPPFLPLPPRPYGYVVDKKCVYSHIGIQNQYISELNASPFQFQFQAFSCLLKDRGYSSYVIPSPTCICVSFQVKSTES